MRSLVLTLALTAVTASGAAGQSLFNTSGLGVPMAPLDGRARALGGIGTGLFGFNPSMTNPADLGGIAFRGAVAAFQPTATRAEIGGIEEEFGATNFPLIRAFYPLRNRWAFGLGYGSAYDQNWSIVRSGTEQVGSGQVQVRDIVRSSGGIAQVRLDAAYDFGDLSVGAGLGLHTGELDRRLLRIFTDSLNIRPFENRTASYYRGSVAAAGVRWDPSEDFRLAGSVTWGGELEVRPEDADSVARTFDMPVQLAVGASAALAPALSATVGARLSRWSDDAMAGQPALDVQNTTEFGAGLEWSAATIRDRLVPLRLGYHRGPLPFRTGGESVDASTLSLGAGIRLVDSEAGPLATVDGALERGSREGGSVSGLSENFWRFTLSVAVFGR